jgi:hypothetical protein
MPYGYGLYGAPPLAGITGSSTTPSEGTDQVEQLLGSLETGPTPTAPPDPVKIATWRYILGALGDALSSSGSVRAGHGPIQGGVWESFLQERRKRQEGAIADYQKRLQENEAARRNLRNQVRVSAALRKPTTTPAAARSEFDRDVGGVSHRIRQILDPQTGAVVSEIDLGPQGYASKVGPDTGPGSAAAARQDAAAARKNAAREAAIVKINNLREQSIDFNSKMKAIRNAIGQGAEPAKEGLLGFGGAPATPGLGWEDEMVDPKTGMGTGLTHRQAYEALKQKNEAAVKEINRLWGNASTGGGTPAAAPAPSAAAAPPRAVGNIPTSQSPDQDVLGFLASQDPELGAALRDASPEERAAWLKKWRMAQQRNETGR